MSNTEKAFLDWINSNCGPYSFLIEHFYSDCENESAEIRKDLLYKWMLASFEEGWKAAGGKSSEIDQSSAPPPDRLYPGDIWEFESEVTIKGRKKRVPLLLQWEVIAYNKVECAWQLKSLDGNHYVYLMTDEPHFSKDLMKRISWGGNLK